MAWEIHVDIPQQQMSIIGELTIFSVQDIRARLLEALAGLDQLTIDLSGVSELDSAGLQLMLLASRQPGKTVRWRHHPGEVRYLMALANVGHLLDDAPGV